MDPIIKRPVDLRPADPLKSSDLLIVSQYIQGTHKIRKTTVGAIKDIVVAGFPNDPTGGGGGGGGGGGQIIVDETTVNIRVENEFIQWQFEGGEWYNLISLATLRSSLVPQISFFEGDGEQLEFGPVPGLSSVNPNKCLVIIGGVSQQPTVSYTLSLSSGGKVIFDEAPPDGIYISVQPY
jgi:hypothetical protein